MFKPVYGSNTMKNKSSTRPLAVDGHWFVHFGAGIEANSPKVEGSTVVEIIGTVNSGEFLDLLSKKYLIHCQKTYKI